MGAQGWTLSMAPSQKDIDQATNARADNTERLRNIDAKGQAVCDKPEYAAYFLKSPCLGKDITLVYLADNTKITQEQKAILLKVRSDLDAVRNERLELIRKVGNAVDKRMADYVDLVWPEVDKYNLDLYNGIITWGEYNQFRKNLTAKIAAEQRSLYQPAQ